MRSLRVFISLLLVTSQLSIFTETARAEQISGVVISQVQAGDISERRFVELYNNNNEPVDITGWCVRYVSASATIPNPGTKASSDAVRACFDPVSSNQHLVLPARSYLLISSSQLPWGADFYMTEGLGSGSSGKVYLVDRQGGVVDLFGWGDSTKNAEGTPKSYGGSDTVVYQRLQDTEGLYVDTNNNSVDFINSVPREHYLFGALFEVDDVCQNLLEIQVVVPEGMVLGTNWQCNPESVDLCDNIDGIQLVLGPGMEVDNNDDCYQDVCLNLPGFQSTVPTGFRADVHNLLCSLDTLPLQVTELLPNPDGDDKNNEFIELYNPNNVALDLSYHVFHLGGDFIKTYSFPIGTTIEPRGYVAIYNKDISFTLTNTLSSLRLRSLDNVHVFDVPEYSNAKTGESWALIDGIWQYTNNPTPGALNTPSFVEQEFMSVALLTDCGEGRERNPITKRCRNIVSSAKSSVKPCKDGQYRSEETNRCRNIITANAKPCKDNQYRSEETNRCRNLPANSVPMAGFAVQPVKDSGMAFVGWWALGGVLLLAGSYAVWEWRRELSAFSARLFKRH